MVLETTGERFVPETMGGQLIEAEHVVRYALAAQVARGRRVLDAGCGVGWGTAMLLAAGAASAAGLDLSAAALENARRRVPDAELVEGDLARLPWSDGAFDLVVCFEALEHVAEQEKTLDELVRVLTPEGLLLVSSPNPRVYPAGNPFHVHELTPEELVQALGRRLPAVELWNQHNQIASVLVHEPRLAVDESQEVLARAVLPLEAGTDPYSVVVGSRSPLPPLPPVLCLAPSSQLLHLEAANALLSEEREGVARDQLRIREERRRLLAEHRRMVADVGQLRREREHIGCLLLESEQELAVARSSRPPGGEGPGHEAGPGHGHGHGHEHAHGPEHGPEPERQVAALEAQVAGLRQEMADLRRSTSWRLTAPLRAASRCASRWLSNRR